METKLEIFAYTSYRAFLSDWLKKNKLSYRAFAEKYQAFVSFIALAKMLSKGKSGTREKSEYRMSPEALGRLGKAMRLSDTEIRHLILLRLENDAELVRGQYGDSYRNILTDMVAENRRRQTSKVKNNAQGNAGNFSPTGRLVIEIFDVFPSLLRQKIIDEILRQGRIYASRQNGKAGVKALHNLLHELSQMRDLGAH